MPGAAGGTARLRTGCVAFGEVRGRPRFGMLSTPGKFGLPERAASSQFTFEFQSGAP